MQSYLFKYLPMVLIFLISCTENKQPKSDDLSNIIVNQSIYFSAIHLESNDDHRAIINFEICNGKILATDNNMLSIAVYDLEGKFINSYTSKGRGPGDFEQVLGNILCLSNGDIVVREGFNRLHYFNIDLGFIKTETVTNLDSRIYNLLAETDSTYVVDFLTTKAINDEHFAIIDKNTLEVIDIIGYGVDYKNTYISLKNSIYSNGKIISGYTVTGKVRIIDLETGTSRTFMTQHEKTIDQISEGMSSPFDRFPNERDIEVRTRGRAIHSIAVFNDEIYVIRDYFTENPKDYLEVFDFDGNLVRKYPLQYGIDNIKIINGSMYGISRGGYEDFTLYKIYLG